MLRHILFVPTVLAALSFAGSPQPKGADLPPGTYLQSCQAPQMQGDTLTATCTNYFGAPQLTSMVNADYCNSTGHDIANVNGALHCIYLWDPNGRGIVSRSKDEIRGENRIKVWRIDQPVVTSPSMVGYSDISFKPGDAISISAGGCVQTGGSGATWKSYTYPQGDEADQLYSGTIQIPGVIGSSVRIAGTMNRDWHVPLDLQPPAIRNLFLRLGYQDDDYPDNGYYAHDDGNNNQCANVGPAWVEIRIVRPLKTPDDDHQTWSPGSLPFDMVWDTDDTQGLPLNPRWHAQKERADATFEPDFVSTCGSAFSENPFALGGNNVNMGVLESKCSSQMPYTDLDTSPFLGLFQYCTDDGILHGHLDWQIATTMGKVQFIDWSTGTGYDDDYNFALFGRDNSLLVNTEGVSLVLEFNSDESIAQFQSPWWASVYLEEAQLKQQRADLILKGVLTQTDPSAAAAIPNPGPPLSANSPLQRLRQGLPGVAIGLIGIDGVHGRGSTESHPVFALAVDTGSRDDKDSRDETWAFFVRNFGNEGNCSELIHYWEGLEGKYYVQLPTPPHWEDVAKVTVTSSDAWLWSSGNNTTPRGQGNVIVAKDSQAMYLEVSLPPAVEAGPNQIGWGVNGEVTIHYVLRPNRARSDDAKRDESTNRTDAHVKSADEQEVNWEAIKKGVPDAAVQQRLQQIFQAAFPGKDVKKVPGVHLSIDPEVHDHKPVLAAHHGGITRPHRAHDPRMAKMNADFLNVLPKDVRAKAKAASTAPAKPE